MHRLVHSNDPLQAVRSEAATCTRCLLYQNATQTVFGEGPADARVMLVGEQPGDLEDIEGRPFVGPAGKLLDKALDEAGVQRSRLYVTNAVKHFKNVPRGKRRIHQRPVRYEIERCRWWLDQEIGLVRPRLAVALGTTAAWALADRVVTISESRGHMMMFRHGIEGFVTIHPSFILRLRDETKEEEYRRFVADLSQIGPLAPEAVVR